jgi:hypothetical protein
MNYYYTVSCGMLWAIVYCVDLGCFQVDFFNSFSGKCSFCPQKEVLCECKFCHRLIINNSNVGAHR